MNITKNNDAFLVEWLGGRSEQKQFLLISDVHFDSKKCNRAALKRTMDEAMEREAGILIFGDWLDVMGHKYDPRSGKSDIRAEYATSNYFENVVDDSVAFLLPYASNLLLISQGNHELAVRKRHEIDLLSIMAYKLKAEAGWSGMIGGYEGWIQFRQRRNQHAAITRTMFFTHGTGGNSPVTRGTIATNRRQVNIDADIFVSGHIHTQWSMPINRRVLNDKGNEELREVLHLQLGTYKESHLDRNGWEAMKGFAAPNIGGYWLKFGFGKGDQSEILTFVEERTR
jgi:predicted phosphodiesterase